MSSGFITENEVVEARKKRQEEWERVRQPGDPVERPEEPYDSRSLYERLQEQKQKKDLEYEEAHKLKNMIKGLDDDEIEFLDLVDRTKLAADRRKEIEEERELNDFRNRVATLQEKSLEERLHAEIAANKPNKPGAVLTNSRTSQQKLLKGVVLKKPSDSSSNKRKMSEESDQSGDNNTNNGDSPIKKARISIEKTDSQEKTTSDNNGGVQENKAVDVKIVVPSSGLKCVGILPGLGCYNDSSSDENSSDSEVEPPKNASKIDILGRKIVEKTKEAA